MTQANIFLSRIRIAARAKGLINFVFVFTRFVCCEDCCILFLLLLKF